jgi:pimeloyl-ACP methyl ester carboxylesterase
MKWSRQLIGFLAGVVGIGCTPAWLKYDQAAENLRFVRSVIVAADFNIAVYKNQWFGSGKRLHVYLDGDGSPWGRGGSWVNADPTPRQYLVLHLMSLDSSPAVLIGRPCYHGFNQDTHCHPLFWTHARYSEKIILAINRALQIIVKENSVSEVVLIGYSGGGTLAQLLAERISQTRAVVTLAGNLDLAAWAHVHSYSPLEGSLNPVERPPLPGHILQIHYVGSSDDNIPPLLAEHYLSRKGGGEIRVLEGVDHYNGWLAHWPGILLDLDRRLQTIVNGL